MPVTEHAQRRAARADALITAQLAFALNGYNWDELAEPHRKTLNREAIIREVFTPLERYCLLNDCEPWECLVAVLNRMKRPDGSRRWKAVRLSDRVFTTGCIRYARLLMKFTPPLPAVCFCRSPCIKK